MKHSRLELFSISVLIFGLQILFVRAFHLFFTELDAQALVPWSFLGILFSCLLLSVNHLAWVKKIIRCLDLRFVCAVMVLYGLSCFVVIHQLSALLMVVLVNLGLGMCLATAAMKMEAYRFYLFDFLGGIAGCIIAFFLPNWFNLETTYLFFLAVAFLTMATTTSLKIKTSSIAFFILSFACTVYLALNPLQDLTQHGALYKKPEDAAIAPKRHGQLQLRTGELRRIFSSWSSIGKIEAHTVKDAPNDIEFFVNNIGYFSLSQYEPRTAGDFGKGKKALVIGAGGGMEMRFLRDEGFTDITAVEINEVVFDMMSHRFSSAAQDIFIKNKFILGEGRNFAELDKNFYDVIVINYVGNAGGLIGSSDDLSENYLFTQEAFNTYYRRLNPGGLLAIGLVYSKNPNPNPLLLRTLETGATTLRSHNEDPSQQFWVLGQERKSASLEHRRYRGLMVMRKGAVSGEHLKSEAKFIEDMRDGVGFKGSYAIVHPDGVAETFAQKAELLVPQEVFARQAVQSSIADMIKKDFALNVFPVSDDRPYFFQFDSHPRFPLKPAGLLFWSCCGLLAAMFWFLAKGPIDILRRRDNLHVLGLAGLLGLAYGILEIALLNSFTIAFSSMTWNFALLVFGLLSGAVVAGALGARLSHLQRKSLITFSAICLAALYFLNFKALIFSYESNYLRSVILILATLVISFGVSLAYPLLLKNCEGSDPRMPAFILGINSGFFILGSIICRYLGLVLSLKHTFLLTGILYLVVVVLLPKAKGQKAS